MCEMHEFNPYGCSGCCCGHVHGPRHFRHSNCCGPVFPSKKEQIERLKDYKQTLQDELNEVENRLKDLE